MCFHTLVLLCSAATQSADAAQTGAGQKSSKELAPGRRKEESKQPVKKPKEKENALSQFDLNNYASESPKSCLMAPLPLRLTFKRLQCLILFCFWGL